MVMDPMGCGILKGGNVQEGGSQLSSNYRFPWFFPNKVPNPIPLNTPKPLSQAYKV